MKKLILIFMISVILIFSANAKIEFDKLKFKAIEFDKLKFKTLVLKETKKTTFITEPFDNEEVTELSRFLQNRKINLNRRYQKYEPKKHYIPEDCDIGYWQKHHVRHYCEWFKVGGKPWKDQETFRKKYLYWENKFSHQRSI